jgi:hypothetical protein
MTLVLRLDRTHTEPKIVRIGGLSAVVGFDRNGGWELRAPFEKVASVFCAGERWKVLFEADHLSCDGVPRKEGEVVSIAHSSVVTGEDFSIGFFPLSEGASVLAQAPAIHHEEVLDAYDSAPILEVRLSPLARTVPLLPGVPVTFGSSEDSVLCLSLPGVRPLHGSVTSSDRGVLVRSLEGALSDDLRQPFSGERVLGPQALFHLEPLGIPLTVYASRTER